MVEITATDRITINDCVFFKVNYYIMNKFQSGSVPKIINNACLNAICETESDLGTDDTIELLSSALPLIHERKKLLDLALQESDLKQASLHAHKTLGSIRLYGTEKLEGLLTQLKNQSVLRTDLTYFQSVLNVEFESVSFTVSAWLTQNRQAS